MPNLKLVQTQPKPTLDHLKVMLDARKRTIDGEVWIPVSALQEVFALLEGGKK